MKIVGVTLVWSGFPQLCYEVKKKGLVFEYKELNILPYSYELIRYAEYYPDGPYSWPKDPRTGEKMEIVE